VAPIDPGLASLLGRVWPALPAGVARAEALGFAWTTVSTPFVRGEDGRTVGHVGLIELPLVVAGQRRAVGAIHAVCTDPDRRGRGLGRALMAEALRAADARYETVVLTTLIPDFYAPFGFRAVREHAFARTLPGGFRRGAEPGRALAETPDDARLLRRLLATRAPVSERLGSLENGVVFAVALMLTWGDLSRVRYHPALDVLTVHEVRAGTVILYDVVGAAIPSLEDLTDALGADAERIVTFFAPDRWGDGWTAEPLDEARATAHGETWFAGLMVRGPLVVTGPMMLPPLSRT
jgi:GNAT superfamily N-acetyltransferase